MDYQRYSIITTQGQDIVTLPYDFLSIDHMFVSIDNSDYIQLNTLALELSENSFQFFESFDEGVKLEFRRLSPADFITPIKDNFNKDNFNREIQNQYNIINEIKHNFEMDIDTINNIADVINLKDPNHVVGDIEIILEGVQDPNKHLICDGSTVLYDDYPQLVPYLTPGVNEGEYILPDYTALFNGNAKFYIRYEL